MNRNIKTIAFLLVVTVVIVVAIFHVYLAFFAPPPQRDRTVHVHRNMFVGLPVASNPVPSVKALSKPVSLVNAIAGNYNETEEQRNGAANELFSLSELPDGVVADLAQMFRSPDEDEVWRDYCLQFLGSALERTDGVTDKDRALARGTLVGALASTNATFAGTALRALHRGAPADPLVASNALRIARDPSYPASSRTTALLILEECTASTASTSSTVSAPSTVSTSSTSSTLAETADAISADPSASPLLRRTAEAVARRHAADAD